VKTGVLRKSKLGQEVKGIPNNWKYKTGDEFLDSLLLDKHPYFFRYLYPSTDSKYKTFVKNYDNKLKNKMGISLEELLSKEGRNEEEEKMVKDYHKHNPVLEDESVMNNLCKHIESIGFDLKNRIKISDESEIPNLLMRNPEINQKAYDIVMDEYIALKNGKSDEALLNIQDGSTAEELMKNRVGHFKDVLSKSGHNVYDITDCLIYIMYVRKPIKNKALLWEAYGDIILENLLMKNENKIRIPVLSKDGEIEYLNKRYTVKEIDFSKGR
jgi:hypothetical protein